MTTVTSKIDSTKQFSNTSQYLKEIAGYVLDNNLYGSKSTTKSFTQPSDNIKCITSIYVKLPLSILAKRGIGKGYLNKVNNLTIEGYFCDAYLSDESIEFTYYKELEYNYYS
jgi:hypothetical protein